MKSLNANDIPITYPGYTVYVPRLYYTLKVIKIIVGTYVQRRTDLTRVFSVVKIKTDTEVACWTMSY